MDELPVEVCLALPGSVDRRELRVKPGSTVAEVLAASGLLRQYPEIDLRHRHRVGVFGRVVDLEAPVHAGDRIEVYRPLATDPRQMRRQAARRR